MTTVVKPVITEELMKATAEFVIRIPRGSAVINNSKLREDNTQGRRAHPLSNQTVAIDAKTGTEAEKTLTAPE